MRFLIHAVILAVLAVGTFGQGNSKARLSQLRDGALSNNTYSNDAVGLSFEFPEGWTVTSDLKGPTNIDYQNRNGLANRCSKVLLWLAAPDRTDGKFSSVATLLAIDPTCLSGPPFPRSVSESKKVTKLAEKIAKVFTYTPFLSPFGNEVRPFDFQGRVTLQLTGGLVMNTVQGQPAAKMEPVQVHTSFTIWESNGYWVAWAYLADDNSAAKLGSVKVVFKNSPTP